MRSDLRGAGLGGEDAEHVTTPRPVAAEPRSLDIGVFGARSIPSTYSGYETFLTTLLPALHGRGHSVTMYCRSGDLQDRGPYEGVDRVRLPAVAGKHLNTLSHGLLASARARMARHDVVLVMNVANSLFCAMNKYTGQRVLLNTDGQEWLRGKWGGFARAFFSFSARVAGHGATGLISDCAAMAEVYRKQFGVESTVIPYCFPPLEGRPETKAPERLEVDRGDYFIVAGRLNPENNIDKVAESYCRSATRRPLLVLGTANYNSPVTARLRAIAAADERVRVVGHVDDREEFFDLVGSASGYIHAHSVGGMNPSLVEAMRAHALVVALDTPFNRETVGNAGLFFKQAPSGELDVEETLIMVEAMDSQQCSTLRASAAARACDLFNIDDVVGAYEKLLLHTAARPSRAPVSMETRWSR